MPSSWHSFHSLPPSPRARLPEGVRCPRIQIADCLKNVVPSDTVDDLSSAHADLLTHPRRTPLAPPVPGITCARGSDVVCFNILAKHWRSQRHPAESTLLPVRPIVVDPREHRPGRLGVGGVAAELPRDRGLRWVILRRVLRRGIHRGSPRRARGLSPLRRRGHDGNPELSTSGAPYATCFTTVFGFPSVSRAPRGGALRPDLLGSGFVPGCLRARRLG
jgi:hypothetical protein